MLTCTESSHRGRIRIFEVIFLDFQSDKKNLALFEVAFTSGMKARIPGRAVTSV